MQRRAPSPLGLVQTGRVHGLRGLCGTSSLSRAVAGTGRVLSRPAPAAAVRALRDLLRILALPRSRDSDAGRACRTGGSLVRRGRHASARRSMAGLAASTGRECCAMAPQCSQIRRAHGRVSGARNQTGERMGGVDAVVCNADSNALAAGSPRRRRARAVRRDRRARRARCRRSPGISSHARRDSSSRTTRCFFSADYRAEFDDIFCAAAPAVRSDHLCVRAGSTRCRCCAGPRQTERLLCLINAPPIGDTHSFDQRGDLRMRRPSLSTARGVRALDDSTRARAA